MGTMKYKIDIQPIVYQDLDEIGSYIGFHLHNAKAARELVVKVLNQCSALADNPKIAHLSPDPTLRRLGIHQFNVKKYTVLLKFNHTSQTVKILRVIYSGRDFGHLHLD